MVDTRKYNEYRNTYYKDKYKQLQIKLRLEKDNDVIEYLDYIVKEGLSRNQYIIQLIREDMKKRTPR